MYLSRFKLTHDLEVLCEFRHRSHILLYMVRYKLALAISTCLLTSNQSIQQLQNCSHTYTPDLECLLISIKALNSTQQQQLHLSTRYLHLQYFLKGKDKYTRLKSYRRPQRGRRTQIRPVHISNIKKTGATARQMTTKNETLHGGGRGPQLLVYFAPHPAPPPKKKMSSHSSNQRVLAATKNRLSHITTILSPQACPPLARRACQSCTGGVGCAASPRSCPHLRRRYRSAEPRQ